MHDFLGVCQSSNSVVTSNLRISIMDELFHELNLYLDPSVAASMGNSAEQNTAALIASSMNSEYEDDWSTPPSSYRDSHTPLTNSSISSNSADHKLGFGINHHLIHDGSMQSAVEVNDEGGCKGFSEENLPLLTFNEYEEIRNYTDLDLLEAAAPTILNEINAACQPDSRSIVAPINQEFKSNDITPIKSKPKKTPSKKKKKQVPNAAMQLQSGSTLSTMEVNEEGGFMGFSEESLQLSPPNKKKIKKKLVPDATRQLQSACNITQVCLPKTLVSPAAIAQPSLSGGSETINGLCDSVSQRQSCPEFTQMCTNSNIPHLESKSGITAVYSKIQETNDCFPHQDICTTESPKKDGNILIKNKLTTKAPSYLTLFPMRCKEYPMIYSCNHCVGIFTSIRAGQLHECVVKRRGRKAGTKLKQSYSRNFSDWSQV